MGGIPYGQCKYCQEQGPIQITYFKFPIACNCCGPTHFEKIEHCKECEPVMPKSTTIWIETSKLLDPVGNGLFKKVT